MPPLLRHPALILAALGALSAVLGTIVPGPGLGEAPNLGLHLTLTGIWFGLVIGFAAWRWAGRSIPAFLISLAATWIGWEMAVNLALQLNEYWLAALSFPKGQRMYLSGFAAGALGSAVTWAGLACVAPRLRQPLLAASVVTVGALFGLLLPLTNNYDTAAVLLVPWQTAVAAALGLGLSPGLNLRRRPQASHRATATR